MIKKNCIKFYSIFDFETMIFVFKNIKKIDFQFIFLMLR